jgi:hypothetical protein
MDERLAEMAQRLAERLGPADLDQTLSNITAAAVEVLPDVTMSSITMKHADGTLQTLAPTDDVLCEVDAKQYELQEGPCYDTATDAIHVTAPHLETDDRYPQYREAALEAGIRAQAGVRLFDTPKSQGALNLYSTTDGDFEDLGFLGALFQHQSAMAIEYAQEVHNLREAMQTRKIVGQAVGIVMERYELTEQRAFAFLARLSQHHNVKLRLVAQEIVAAGEARAQ